MNEKLVDGFVDYLRTAEPGYGLDRWLYLPEVHAAWVRLAEEEVERLKPRIHGPELNWSGGNGRGIVTMAGGQTYLPGLFFLLHQLKRTGTKLPVEVWYLGDREMDRKAKELLAKEYAGGDLRIRDLTAEGELRMTGGWECKPACLLRSAFREVLWIDADNAPVRDPAYLFEEPGYEEKGAMFWPDFVPYWLSYPRTQNTKERMLESVYATFGLPLPRVTTVPGNEQDWFGAPTPGPESGLELPCETGQLVIDKARCWRELALAHWYAQHGDHYYNYVHGDTGVFPFAWRKFKTPYALPPRMPDSTVCNGVYHTVIQHDGAGRKIFEHRNHPAFKWHLGVNPDSGDRKLQLEGVGVEMMKDLSRRWTGKLWDNDKPTQEESVQTLIHSSKSWFYHRVGQDARLMNFLPDRTIGTGADDHERRWSYFRTDEDGGRLVISSHRGPTVFLRLGLDGCWEGKWLGHDQAVVRLEPAGGKPLKPVQLTAEQTQRLLNSPIDTTKIEFDIDDFYPRTKPIKNACIEDEDGQTWCSIDDFYTAQYFGKTEPCCECGDGYPRENLVVRGEIYCQACLGAQAIGQYRRPKSKQTSPEVLLEKKTAPVAHRHVQLKDVQPVILTCPLDIEGTLQFVRSYQGNIDGKLARPRMLVDTTKVERSWTYTDTIKVLQPAAYVHERSNPDDSASIQDAGWASLSIGLAGGKDLLLFIEDDVEFCPDFLKRLTEIHLTEKTGCVSLYRPPALDQAHYNAGILDRCMVFGGFFFGTKAVLFTRKGAEWLVANRQQVETSHPGTGWDLRWYRGLFEAGFEVGVTERSLVQHLDRPSRIGSFRHRSEAFNSQP